MKSLRQQKGLGFAGWMIMLMALGSVISIGIKVAPLYSQHNTMSNLLDKMALEDGLAGLSQRTIKEKIQKRFKLNNIRDFDIDGNIEVKFTKNDTRVIMDYETRVPLVHNLDLIAAFNKEIELRN